jgi:peptidoglycan hydrolase-like protein with peptidoglycan-binding domain
VRILEQGLGFRTRDSVFDADTDIAVRAFQQGAGLPVTGIVNRATWDALEKRHHPLVEYWRTVLRPGSTGAAVIALQTALGVPADGEYGADTVAAVKAAQARHHLAQTGYVGTLTWRAIDGDLTTPQVPIGSLPRRSSATLLTP